MVGAARFELATSGTQNQRATRLRYTPWPRPLQALRAVGKGFRAGGIKLPIIAMPEKRCPPRRAAGAALSDSCTCYLQGQASAPCAISAERISAPGTIPSRAASPPLISST